jgi:hypothetical protein
MTAVQTQTRKYDKFYTDRNEKMTLKHFYQEYPYKKRECPTCLPYIADSEISNHSFALTYFEWQKIIMLYFKYLILFLLSGQVYRFSSKIGELQLIKWKPKKRKVDIYSTLSSIMKKYKISKQEAAAYYKEHKEEAKTYSNRHLDGYKWRVIWKRSGYNVKNISIWAMMLQKKSTYDFIHNYLKENPNHIHQISEV